ncbi:hypothetical protein [Streptomyces antimycoticus]|uniref:hypothetical protein n=1 Tax=Streptomyces antimycoticus TaxID=68175 RepID=UPI0036E9A2B2
MEETEGTPPMEAPAPDLGRGNTGHDPLPEAARDMDRDNLSRLIRDANYMGLSYQEMADRSEAAGYPVSKPYLQKLATNAVATAPSPDRLEGIAAALRKPVAVIQRAAAIQYLNYQATELSGYDDDVRVIVAHLAGMDPRERKRWRRMLEAADRIDEE